VKDVLPALKTNSDGLKQVLEELLRQYKSKQDEMDRWKVCLTVPLRCTRKMRSYLAKTVIDILPLQKKNNIQVVQSQ
jgi:hypothetical protein